MESPEEEVLDGEAEVFHCSSSSSSTIRDEQGKQEENMGEEEEEEEWQDIVQQTGSEDGTTSDGCSQGPVRQHVHDVEGQAPSPGKDSPHPRREERQHLEWRQGPAEEGSGSARRKRARREGSSVRSWQEDGERCRRF